MLDQGYTLKVGDVMFHRNPSDGSRQPAFVTELTADQARIDLNHPFAGKDLEYWVKVEEVK
jgi:FKBP-type peptidyl-prolyl cis-trans isomerase 2